MPTVTIERETLEATIDALEEVDALIAYQFTGTRPAMTALQYACDHAAARVPPLRAALAAQPAEQTMGKGMAQELMEWIECLPIPTRGASHWARRLNTFLEATPAPAAVPPDEKLLALAREYASVVYTNRHFPDTPAFSFPTGKLLSFARAVLATGDKP